MPGYPRIPVWVDEDLDKSNSLFDTIKRKLAGWLPEEEIETEFLEALLRKQRILVIIDRISERSASTLQHIVTIHGYLHVEALVITTRKPLTFEAGPSTFLYPQALDSSSLLHFMTSLLRQHKEQEESGKEPFASLEDQLALGKRLAALIRVRGIDGNPQDVPILPLPVKIFVDNAIVLIRQGRFPKDLPSTLPDVYFRYLEQINPKSPAISHAMTDEEMLRAAKLLGKLALEHDFIPKEFSKEIARERLRAAGWTNPEKLDPIQRLLDNGVIIEKKAVLAIHRMRFALDPIAEFLAAAAWTEECSNNQLWNDLEQRSIAAPGFHTALQLIVQNYPTQLGHTRT